MEHIKFAVINGMEDGNDGNIEIVYGDEAREIQIHSKNIK